MSTSAVINPFAAMMSLENESAKSETLKPFCLLSRSGIKTHSIESRCVIGLENILFVGLENILFVGASMHLSAGNLYSEGVNTYIQEKNGQNSAPLTRSLDQQSFAA